MIKSFFGDGKVENHSVIAETIVRGCEVLRLLTIPEWYIQVTGEGY